MISTIYHFKHLEAFLRFVTERHSIYLRRLNGQSAPWTDDKILNTYKFCNVYRELDRTTQWIAEHWRNPFKNEPDLWFSMVVARFVNHPPTLAELALPGRWNKAQFLKTMRRRKAAGHKQYGGAYIIATGGTTLEKAVYLAEHVFDPMWDKRESIRPTRTDTLQSFFTKLESCTGMGSFMTAQVIADLKYVRPLEDATDWWTFASSGPGSRRGMAYLLGLDPNTHWREHEWREALISLVAVVRHELKNEGMPRMHAQDVQNCLCEFSKYWRTKKGTGRPKQKFVPFTKWD